MLYKRATFETAVELWREKAERMQFSPKTVRNTETFVGMLARFVPLNRNLGRFTADEFEQAVTQMRVAGYAPETVHDLVTTLRKLLNLSVRKKLVRRNVFEEVENPRRHEQRKTRVISYSDFASIAGWLDEREYRRNGENTYHKYRFLFTLLYYSGMRIGEALALSPADFTFDGEIWRVKIDKSYLYDFKLVKTTKNGKIREIPLSDEVFGEFLRAIRAREQSAQIFQFSPQAAREMLHKICEELELPRYRLHEFRHAFISRLIASGVPLPVVAEVSGDTQITILQRYSHVFRNNDKIVLTACASDHAAQPERHPAQERLRRLRCEHHELSNK